MRHYFFILGILLGLSHAMAADPGEVTGTVIDALTSEPVPGAIVKAKDSFTSTNANGEFKLKVKNGADSVSFRCMGYEILILPVSADMSSIRLSPKATRLKDVIIEAPDIYAKGDTLVFNVDRYANSKDNAIIDVIKRLPGIKVEEDGTIKYQGKPINKFYLDGNDFLGGQYGLATENISYKDVASVEVMEKHQPIKALEGIEFPEEAGINLKLKEDARSRWVGVAKAGSGAEPVLYNGSLFTMRIAPKIQNMFTLKADNTGWNPANEIKEHDFNEMFQSEYSENLFPQYISADIVNAPLSEKRTRDNQSMLANAIMSLKSGDTSMRLKLNYSADRLHYNSGTVTDYFDSRIPSFIQHNRLRAENHDLSAQFNSETNKRGYYLKDKLTLTSLWDNSNSAISGSFNLDQQVARKRLSATNDLKLVKRSETRLITITSRNSFVHHPDRLHISDRSNTRQSIGTNDFRSTTETQFGRLSRFLKFYMTAGIDLNYLHMNTSLSGMNDFDNADIYNYFLSDIYATPQIDYERHGWRLSFKTPLKWLHYSVGRKHDYTNVSPSFSIRKSLTAKSEFSTTLSYRVASPQPYLNIDNPILSDYRNIFIGYNPDKYSREMTVTISYRYRNPLKTLFFNASCTYSHKRSSIMSNQLFIGDMIVSTFADKLSNCNIGSFNAGISKGLGRSKMVTGIDFNSTISSASSMRDNEILPYRQVSLGAKPYFKGSIIRWLSVNYEANYGFSSLKIEHESNNCHSFTQNLFLTLIPTDLLQFTAGAEHFLTQFSGGKSSTLTLLDASADYRLNGKIRLSLTARNLLNGRNYRYVNYGTLSRSERYFQIRSRSIVASIQYRF